MGSLISHIKSLSDEIFSEVAEMRKHLHQFPELSFEEVNTAQYISEKLSSFGIEHKVNVAGHGVVGIIEGELGDSEECIALRADMDALPIHEENAVEYRSRNQGVMHACGHDVHTSSLLGTAWILSKLRKEFSGKVKLIFQPAEEKLPGGASLMISEGVLENPTPLGIFGQHVHPELPTGKIGLKAGMFMASADEIFISILGQGGHGAMPHKTVDTVLTSAYLLTLLQQVVSRKAPATIPTVLTFGKIYSEGGATNIIPQRVNLEGTLRTMDEQWRKQAHQEIKQVVKSISESMGAKIDIEIKVGYPYLKNDPKLTNNTWKRAAEFLGEENVVALPLRMTAEDFSFYSQVIPACFYRLGVGRVNHPITPVHTPTFDIDFEALRLSIGFMAYNAIGELKKLSSTNLIP